MWILYSGGPTHPQYLLPIPTGIPDHKGNPLRASSAKLRVRHMILKFLSIYQITENVDITFRRVSPNTCCPSAQ